MAGNAIVCFNKDGLTTTLKGYSGILDADWFNDSPESREISEEEYEKLATQIADRVIFLLSDDCSLFDAADEMTIYCSRYTWKNAAMTWLKEWGLIYE
jgi:hypothetical protein